MGTTDSGTGPSAEDVRIEPLVVSGDGLTVSDIVRVADGAPVAISRDERVRGRVDRSRAFVVRALEEGVPIYGVTTLFGGMADHEVPREAAALLQQNLVRSHKTGAGAPLPLRDVRAAMLLRANSLLRGVSAVRMEVIERFEAFLNAGITPLVCELGSIGASGDLVPLAYIAGAVTGASPAFRVSFDGEEMPATAALSRLGLAPLPLEAKEGLGLINGTSVMTGIAANCVQRARTLLAGAVVTHGLYLQGLHATNQSFHPFIHAHKPHAGQRWAAEHMLRLLDGSRLIQDELDGRRHQHAGDLIQDRYSIRCLPQYLGPIVDGLATIARQIEVEANSATDNPLIDAEVGGVYHCGNFLGQYVGIAMDQLRYYIGLTAKHLDAQIALLVAPEFNRGLSPSLVGNTANVVNVGLKPLQISGNSIMPLLSFYGSSLADRFPTHAEQFNQNINSQGFGSANLARQALDLFEQYMAIALIFAVQAVDLRAHAVEGHYDARRMLSPATAAVYEAVRRVVGRPPAAARPLVWDDSDQFLDAHIAAIAEDLAGGGVIAAAFGSITQSLEQHVI